MVTATDCWSASVLGISFTFATAAAGSDAAMNAAATAAASLLECMAFLLDCWSMHALNGGTGEKGQCEILHAHAVDAGDPAGRGGRPARGHRLRRRAGLSGADARGAGGIRLREADRAAALRGAGRVHR